MGQSIGQSIGQSMGRVGLKIIKQTTNGVWQPPAAAILQGVSKEPLVYQ